MIVAKAVIPNQYWILRQDDRKIGNIEAEAGGFAVKINNQVRKFKSITTIKKNVDINFESIKQSKKSNPEMRSTDIPLPIYRTMPYMMSNIRCHCGHEKLVAKAGWLLAGTV